MSDDEEYEEEVEYEEEDEDNKSVKSAASSAPEPLKYKRSLSTRTDTVDESNLNEAEKAMIASKKRHDDDEAFKIQEYEARRRNEREKEEEELRILKEKQEQRRLQREEEEREQAERRMQEEERRRIEEEERKARIEEERKRKEDAIKKRQQLMGAGFVPPAGTGGRNFVIPEKKDKGDKFGNIVQAKQEMGLTSKQQDDAKQSFMATLVKALDISDFSGDDLKAKLKEMHQRICKLETEKYDLEKRHERQEYDLKELNARQSQIVRNRAINKGVDPSEINSRYPPKISVASKYDRQTDRGNFTERRKKFDKKGAFPCFPNVPPPTRILEFKLTATEEEDE